MKCKVTVDTSHYPKEGLPDGWAIASVEEVFQINPKNHEDEETASGFVPMASISDGFSDCFTYEVRPWKSIKSGFTHFANNDVAVAKISPCLENRKSFVVKGLPNGIGAGTTELFVFRSSEITPEYSLLFFKSDFFISSCVGTFNGVVGQQRASRSVIEELAFPIPPRSEQLRIVQKVKSLFGGIDKIEQGQDSVDDYVTKSKAKILELAIHGKLVPQNPTDEPAIELLRRINPAFTPSDNLHYPFLPIGWCECRLQDCVNILNGFAFKSFEYTDFGIRVIRITNVQNGFISDEDPKFFPSSRAPEIERYLLKEGDLLMSLTGNVGRVAFLEKNMLPAALNQRVACIRSSLPSEVLFFVFFLCQTNEFADACVSSGKGVAQLNISTEWLKEYKIAIPPLNEIRRILKAVNEYLRLLDEIAKF